MATVYLYVKQHSITGLKYFGKTVRDPNTYYGSGTYWNRHIDKHGREYVETVSIWKFETQSECTEFALNFSKENNIVESNEWANLMEENGISGGKTNNSHFKRFNKLPKSQDIKNKISKARKGVPNVTRMIPVIINDTYYPSLRAAANAIGKSEETIRLWALSGKIQKA